MPKLTPEAVTDPTIYEWVHFACEKNGVPELADRIEVVWNRRFTRKLGDAIYSKSRQRGRIRLSVPLWERCSETQKRETTIHEACHVVVGYKFRNDIGNIKPHGREWRDATNECDVEPQIYHNIDRVGLAYFFVRDCEKSRDERCRVSRRDRNRLVAGSLLHCSDCGRRVGSSQLEEYVSRI